MEPSGTRKPRLTTSLCNSVLKLSWLSTLLLLNLFPCSEHFDSLQKDTEGIQNIKQKNIFFTLNKYV